MSVVTHFKQSPQPAAAFRAAARLGSLALFVIGALGLVGWLRNDPAHKSILLGLSSISLTIAAGLVWLSAASIEREARKRRHTEDLFRLAINASPTLFFLVDAQGIIVLVSEHLEKMLLYQPGELVGKSIDAIVPERYRAGHEQLRGRFMEQPLIRPMAHGRTFVALRRDGSEAPIEIGLNPAHLDGSPFVLASVVDLSARQLAEERFQATFEQAAVGMAHGSPEGRWLAVNQKFCDIVGYTREELLALSFRNLTHPEDLQADLANQKQLQDGTLKVVSREKRYLRKDGSVVWIHLTVSPVRTAPGSPNYFVAVIEDISRRRQAEENLRTAEARFRPLFESNIIGFLIGDVEGNILDANPAFLNMLGYTREELLPDKVRWTELTAPEYRDLDKRAIAQLRTNGVAPSWEKEYIRKDGSRVPILIGLSFLKGTTDTCIAFVLDLSEKKKLETQLRQAQRMEVIGRLAGGVAHDFNNLLTPIVGYSALILAQMSKEDPLYEDLAEIQKAGQRASALTRQLLAFSRKQVLKPAPTDLNALITEAVPLLQPLIGKEVKLELALASSVHLVTVDAAQIEQTLMSLAANARDAMSTGGTLTIETANVHLSEDYAHNHPEVTPGPHTLLVISDTGSGMSKEVASHLFEPFYTTKERGHGTGLGLATVHGIIKQNQGHIWVYSEVGHGSTFKIYFPVSDERIAPQLKTVHAQTSARGSETILLVEDEKALRTLAARVLRAEGYQVLEAENGERALDLGKSFPGIIDLLITDVVMPGIGGQEVARQIAANRLGLQVLYVSGYTENAIVNNGILAPGTELLEKPFTPAGLARRVRTLLDGLHRSPTPAEN